MMLGHHANPYILSTTVLSDRLVNVLAYAHTLSDIVNMECVERLIKHKAKLSYDALRHIPSKLYPVMYVQSRYINWFSVR